MNQTINKSEKSLQKTLFVEFPKSISVEESSIFFTKVFGAAVSHLTYLRGIFPEYLYQPRYFQDIDLKILHGTKLYPSAHELLHQIGGIFHAFHQKYLEQAILGFHSVHDASMPIETYIFKFAYPETDNKPEPFSILQKSEGTNDSSKCSINVATPVASNRIEESTMQLFNQIILATRGLGPLPRKVVLRWKLLYFDKITPKDYEPPGFKRASRYIPVSQGNCLGHIVTPFHQVLCYTGIDNEKNLLEAKSSESIVSNFVTDNNSW